MIIFLYYALIIIKKKKIGTQKKNYESDNKYQ